MKPMHRTSATPAAPSTPSPLDLWSRAPALHSWHRSGGLIHALCGLFMLCLCGVSFGQIAIGEIHYDNTGADSNERLEVVGYPGTDLTGWTIQLYDGANGQTYGNAINLSSIAATMPASQGTVSGQALSTILVDVVAQTGFAFQNGNGFPDGWALMKGSTVVELLSYEGTFTATNGPANGITSADIGAFEDGAGANTGSIQRLVNNTWVTNATTNSFGALNSPSQYVPFNVISIAPTSGSTAGGTNVTITGVNFASGVTTAATVGGVALTSFSVVNSTTITGVTGAHAAGAVDVVVSAPGTWNTLANAYTYGGAPVTAPTVTTATQSGVTHNSATLGGNVTADGGASVTDRGIVWGTSADPTTGNNKVQIGTGTGVFSQLVTGLPPSTTVHVRAYAINTAGTAYGSNISFATNAAPVAVNSLNRANPNPSRAATVNWTLTFANTVTGVTASNFTLTGAAAAGASVGTPSTGNGGLSWTVPVTTGGTDGTLTLNLANATGLSAAISNTLPYAGQNYDMDKTPPTVLSVARLNPTGQQTNNTSVIFRVTYSEPVALNAPETARFQVVPLNGSDITGTVASVSGTGDTRDVTVNLTGGTGEFRLRVID